eukprot:356917-Chlamydomonas_euryale.AAC.9
MAAYKARIHDCMQSTDSWLHVKHSYMAAFTHVDLGAWMAACMRTCMRACGRECRDTLLD